jgi:hypothetical protein
VTPLRKDNTILRSLEGALREASFYATNQTLTNIWSTGQDGHRCVMTEKRGRRLWEPAALLSSNSFLNIASKIMRSTRNGAQGTQRGVCQPIIDNS